jgi:hypothetical protein
MSFHIMTSPTKTETNRRDSRIFTTSGLRNPSLPIISKPRQKQDSTLKDMPIYSCVKIVTPLSVDGGLHCSCSSRVVPFQGGTRWAWFLRKPAVDLPAALYFLDLMRARAFVTAASIKEGSLQEVMGGVYW